MRTGGGTFQAASKNNLRQVGSRVGTQVMSERSRKAILTMQRNEITEYHIYSRIASRLPGGDNQNTLLRLAAAEKRHCEMWAEMTGVECLPNKAKIFWYDLLARICGYTFTLKLMESGENVADKTYAKLAEEVPQAHAIAVEEEEHENALLAILDEKRLQYVGSMVLGLNDALVELTGTLAGLTLAMKNTGMIAMAGLITGIAATLSMGSSEYLSSRSEGRDDAFTSCLYTSGVYFLTVAILVAPYLVFGNGQYLEAMATMLVLAVVIILVFTYYISVAKDLNFKKRFLEMAGISLGVALISFVIGIFVKEFLGIDL